MNAHALMNKALVDATNTKSLLLLFPGDAGDDATDGGGGISFGGQVLEPTRGRTRRVVAWGCETISGHATVRRTREEDLVTALLF